MTTVKKTQHSVWVRDDLWNVLQAHLTTQKQTLTSFLEECIIEKTGLNNNQLLEKEIIELKQQIQQTHQLLKAKEEYLKTQQTENNQLDQHRYKLLKHLLKKPVREWTVSKKIIIKDGKFKNWDEVVEWVHQHQQKNMG